MENGRQCQSSMPLISRLDHLDFIMKYLEGKQNMTKWSRNRPVGVAERQSMPLDSAVREAYFKGLLMDRVTSLEHRLFQLCLEMESSSTSGSSSQTSGYASSSGQGSKNDPCFSLPTFNNPNHQGHKQESLVLVNGPRVQEKPHKEDQARRNSNPIKQKLGKNRPNRVEKICKSGKK